RPAQPGAAVGDDRLAGDDRGEQRPRPHGVVARVVDPPRTELGVLHLREERVRELGGGGTAVGERHLVDDGGGAGLVAQEPRLDADLAVRVLEPRPADPPQLGRPSLGGVPPLPADPAGQDVPERRRDRGHQSSRDGAGGSGPAAGWSGAASGWGSGAEAAEGGGAAGGVGAAVVGSIRSQKKSREPSVIVTDPAASTSGNTAPPKMSVSRRPAAPGTSMRAARGVFARFITQSTVSSSFRRT